MRKRHKIIAIALAVTAIFVSDISAKQVIKLSPTAEDMTPVVREAIESINDKDVKIILEKGTYKFLPNYALDQYCTITNHGNGLKKIAFLLEGLNSIEIEGNGSELIFHGQMAPFQFIDCREVKTQNLSIDWDIPYTFVGEVIAINKEEGWRDIMPYREGFNWEVKKGVLYFPNVDGFNYQYLGSTLPFDKEEKRVVHGGQDQHSRPTKVVELKNGNLRIYENLKYFPPVGSVVNSKGDRHNDRYAPAFQVKYSDNVTFDNVIVHHALGMGYLFERTDGIKILNSGVYLNEPTKRVVSSTADATHFANCKGDILIENCRFENMLDDGTNVHGTYVMVDEIIDAKTVRVELKHFEQLGFRFAEAEDVMWFIHAPHVDRKTEGTVSKVNMLNDRFIELTFEDNLPSNLKEGDMIENKTWNPVFTMRGCTIRDHRARNVVLKTPLKTVIEDNHFSSMMSSILFRGESFFWYESGVVEDVLIQNNTFEYCAYNGRDHAILNITPRLGKTFDQTELYDRNIRFVNNTIKTFDNRIVWADRVEGLLIEGNKITKVPEQGEQLCPDAPLFEFINSKDVTLKNNSYTGEYPQAILADDKSTKTLKDDGSIK